MIYLDANATEPLRPEAREAALSAMGLAEFVSVDLGVVRGLAYYTGFVFEAFDRQGDLRALAGGGRYDDLVEKLGGPSLLSEIAEQTGGRHFPVENLNDLPDVAAIG